MGSSAAMEQVASWSGGFPDEPNASLMLFRPQAPCVSSMCDYAVVICPGGAYKKAYYRIGKRIEGPPIAVWLATHFRIRLLFLCGLPFASVPTSRMGSLEKFSMSASFWTTA